MKTEHNIDPFDIFHPVEHSIIAFWLGVKPPPGCPDFGSLPLDAEPTDHIGLKSPEYDYPSMLPVENAVARIALRGVEGSLPQWAACNGDGTYMFGRDLVKAPDNNSNLALLPQFLFLINWADSGPGFSWPESYHMTWFPWYDRFVVTASHDCTEVFGYTDYAYGSFPAGRPVLEELEALFINNWGSERFSGVGSCWDYFWEEGLVGQHHAVEWAQKVPWVEGIPDNWYSTHGLPEPQLEEDY